MGAGEIVAHQNTNPMDNSTTRHLLVVMGTIQERSPIEFPVLSFHEWLRFVQFVVPSIVPRLPVICMTASMTKRIVDPPSP